MKLRLLAAAIALAAGAAHADCTLTWTAPTHNESGSLLTDLAGYKVYVGATQGGPYVLLADVPDTTYVMSGFAVGLHYAVVTAYNEGGVESDYSNEALCRVYAKPNPPSNLTATRLVYSVKLVTNGFTLTPVGEVPAGTPCTTTQSVNGLYVVPRWRVTVWYAAKPSVVVADCV